MKRVIGVLLVVCLCVSACGLLPTSQTQTPEMTTDPLVTDSTGTSEPLPSMAPSVPPTSEATAPPTTEDTTPPTEEPTVPPTQAPTETTAPTEPKDDGPDDDTLVRVADYIPDIVVDLKYATKDNFTGQVIYEFTDVYLRYGTVKKLAAVQKALKEQGLGLKIWDGFRPVYGQYRLWEACPDPTYVSDPSKGTSSHCRGNTVDVTLLDANGNELEMPTGFDDFTAKADRDYSDCTEAAAANAKLLEKLMKKNGFKGYSAEWWHYTDTTNYPIETEFDPAVISTWTVNCLRSVSLRKKPDVSSGAITGIKKGKEVTLLGWNYRFAYVEYNGKRGYVLADYILPTADDSADTLTVVEPTATYTYQQMYADLQKLAQTYSQHVTLSSIGTSENGTDIPVLTVGKLDAKHHILIHAGIHAREHMTCWLLTALAELWLTEGQPEQWDVCFHLIPMVNPDGVAISQTGTLPEDMKAVYNADKAAAYTDFGRKDYALHWKANAKGVDLNRNFDAGWAEYESRENPSSERYKGTAPFSAAEAEALRQYTLKYTFDLTVSYHATGSIIYATCGGEKSVIRQSEALARDIGFVTGYPLEDSTYTDRAGYKDWAGDILGIPSITIEIGSESAPLQERELETVFSRNREVLQELARWATNQ